MWEAADESDAFKLVYRIWLFWEFVRCPLGLFVTVFVLFINLRPMELANDQIHACGMRIQ